MKGLRWLKRLGAVLAALVGLGLIYEQVGGLWEARLHPPLGRLVSVGDRSYHLYCVGQGRPTVVLEAGQGEGMLFWHGVQTEVAKATRVCAYDRAGLGWSVGSTPESGREMAADLHQLLAQAGETGPYVLAGHSLGGMLVQIYAAQYPDEVAGMALVDGRPAQYTELAPGGRQALADGVSGLKLLRTVSRFGVMRLLGKAGAANSAGGAAQMDAALRRTMWFQKIRPGSLSAAMHEAELVPILDEELRQSPTLGNRPLVVLVRDPAAIAQAGGQPEQEEVWQELQRQALSLSSRSRLVMADGSGHDIPLERPDLVSSALLEMVQGLAGR